ncbi:effector-associated domain EAD1-containing protein [Streptomyces sp. NPDC004579]|uniref:effector-associated domain EAD1-containing protein n=1 Tax=Streptomyces sp. NPDC004579 TaxID=3154667 RepID=UPI0033A41439
MARKLKGAGISRSTIHDAFTSDRLPKWVVVDALIEVLSSSAPGGQPEQTLRALHGLWMAAAQQEVASADGDANATQLANFRTPPRARSTAPSTVQFDSSFGPHDRNLLVNTLAALFSTPHEARRALNQIEFPPSQWPAWEPQQETGFWGIVVHSLELGVIQDGPIRLVEEALRVYPANLILHELREKLRP